MVCQEGSRGLLVHRSSLVDVNYTKEVWYVWQPMVLYRGWGPLSYGEEECSEMSGILFRDTKVSWGVCTRRVRLEEGLTKIEVIKHTLIPVHSKSL